MHGYCNLAGIQIRSFPELSALLFYSENYRNKELPCEGVPTCTEKTFTNVELKFGIDIRSTISCLNSHYNMESDNNSEDEEEHPVCLAMIPSSSYNMAIVKNKKEAVSPKRQAVAALTDQDEATERSCLNRKAMELVGKTKFMRSFIKHKAKTRGVLWGVDTKILKIRSPGLEI